MNKVGIKLFIYFAFITLLLFGGLLINAVSAPNLSANAFGVMNLATDEILLIKNQKKVYPIASVTKLMNAVVSAENGNLINPVVLTPLILKPLGWSPSLFSYARVKGSDLLMAALIQSSNDAANALSKTIPQNKGTLVSLMNKKAKLLGMTSTRYLDVYGLDKRNVSNVKDLLVLARYMYKNQLTILNITKENYFWLPDNKGILRKFKNVNIFSTSSALVGGKTGYTSEAKHTFVGVFNVKNTPFAIVLLRDQNRKDLEKDTTTILSWLENN